MAGLSSCIEEVYQPVIGITDTDLKVGPNTGEGTGPRFHAGFTEALAIYSALFPDSNRGTALQSKLGAALSCTPSSPLPLHPIRPGKARPDR